MMRMARSFKNAFAGLWLALRTERNMGVHLAMAWLVLICAYYGEVEPWAWTVIIVCFGFVIGLEQCNTAFEKFCDRLVPEREVVIRDIKDLTAGAVLWASFASAATGLIIFLREEVRERIFAAIRDNPVILLWLLGPLLVFVVYSGKGKRK